MTALALLAAAPSAHAAVARDSPQAHVARPRLADLVVRRAPRAPASLAANQALNVVVRVRNGGRRPARASAVRLYLSRDARRDRTDTRLLGTLAVKALKPRRRATARGRVTAPGALVAGRYRLLACADDLRRVREAAESNNCRAGSGVVTVAGQAPVPGPGPGAPGASLPAAGGPGATIPPAGGPGAGDPAPPGNAPTPEPTAVPTAPPGQDGPPAHPNEPTPLDRGAATSLADADAFLYTGPNAPQQGVAPGAISPKRIAVLRGRVLDVAGAPLAGVRVSVLHHGEYGRTWTDADGHYDLVVNGAELDVVYEHAGFLPVQRQVQAPWQDYQGEPDVLLTAIDTSVTRLDPASTAPFQVARGSQRDGSPPATLLFPQGVQATLEMPDGSTRPAPSMSVRATEFPASSQSLPGTMPGNVGLTYAAEFSLDEAIAAGAESVGFDRDVLDYTENFIHMPVGAVVPTAYYDRGAGQWIPSRNGRVIRITAISGGVAQIDADRTPGADSDAALAAKGITVEERRTLATLYAAGTELWRVPIRHFTPWDHNFPYGLPKDAKPPQLKEFEWKDPSDPCRASGSIIGCERQTLSEALPVTGTDLQLRYDSDRQAGYTAESSLKVPVTSGAVADKLQGIEATVDIAGHHYEKRWCDPDHATTGASTCAGLDPVAPNVSWDVGWDGTDGFGRKVLGRPAATVVVTYVYEFEYYESPESFDASFGAFPEDTTQVVNGAPYCGNQNPAASPEQSRRSQLLCGILARQTVQQPVGPWLVDGVDGLGGLTLSAHHGYDPTEQVLHRGDGNDVAARALGSITRTLAGNVHGDGFETTAPRDATSVDIDYLTASAVGPDGSVYGHSGLNQNKLWRVDPAGKIAVIAGVDRGNDNADRGDPTGDGGPATQAVLGGVDISALDVGPDGSVYFGTEMVSKEGGIVRRVRPDGIIETIAGKGWTSSDTANAGDNGPARNAKLGAINDLAVGPDGSIFLAEQRAAVNGGKPQVRRITPQGTITRVAGGGTGNVDTGDLGAGEPARDAQLGSSWGVLPAPDGTLYIADPAKHRIVRVGTDGILRRFAGNGTSALDLGRSGLQAGVGSPIDLAMDGEGRLIARINDDADYNGSPVKLVALEPDGLVTPLAGRTTAPRCRYCVAGDREPAGNTMINNHSTSVDALPDGRIVFSDGRTLVRAIEPAMPGFGTGDNAIASSDATQVFRFDRQGRHLDTRDAVTGAVVQRFGYDAARRLSTVTDAAGNVTRIERAADGTPQAIVAPGGQRTTLTVDGQGRVTGVADPTGATTVLGYGASGLLTSFARPGRPASHMAYDGQGRLTSDTSPTGATKHLARAETESGRTVTVTTEAGRSTSYRTQALPDGDRLRSVTSPSGAVTELRLKPDGRRVRIDPDGTRTTVASEPDPRFGSVAAYPASTTVETPGGRSVETTTTRSADLQTPDDPLSLRGLSSTTITEGATSGDRRQVDADYDAAGRTLSVQVRNGVTTTTTFDALGRVTEVDPGAGLDTLAADYDAKGRPVAVTVGTRRSTLSWDAANQLVSRTDADGHTTRYERDADGRIVKQTLPGGAVYRYAYAADGTPTTTTTPNGNTYASTSDGAGRTTSMTPPGTAAYTRDYDADGVLKRLGLPSGAAISTSFAPSGRATGTTDGAVTDAIAYAPGTDEATRLTRSRAGTTQGLDLHRDGPLATGYGFDGPAAGSADFAYNDLLELTGITLKAAGDTAATTIGRDDAGRPATTGGLDVTRDYGSDLVTGLADADLDATYTHDGAGQLTARTLKTGSPAAVRYADTVTWTPGGQVAARTERIGGASTASSYTYDPDGRLTTVKQGGATTERYAYDGDGNRTSRALGTSAPATADYDAADRLTRLGTVHYDYDADGFLAGRGADTFTYAPSGALLSATAGGTTVTYGSDALGRRTSRTTTAGTERYLYGDPHDLYRVTGAVSPDDKLWTYTYDDEGQLVAIDQGATRFYVGADQVGTPRVVFKADGTVAKRIDYADHFGVVKTDSAPGFFLPIGFAGGLADAMTGLVRMGQRDYDPAAGRFTGRDPLLFGGSPTNLFAYVNSDPVSKRDPTGQFCIGGSLYVAVGGGSQFCYDPDKNQKSLCLEVGVGEGGGLELDPFAGAQSDSFKAFVQLTGKLGVGQVGGSVELDLNCFNVTAGVSAGAGPFVAGIDSTGSVSTTFGGSSREDFDGRGVRNTEGGIGTKLEGKVGIKRCWAG